MEDFIYFKGEFTAQTIDKITGKVVDEYNEKNLIMEASRATMAKLFSQISGQSTISELVVGTFGHQFTGSNISTNITSPKTSANGFIKTRDRLFSQFVSLDDTATSATLNQNDLIKYTGTSNSTATTNNYYIWLGNAATAINISATDFSSGAGLWQDMGTTEPMVYHVEFGVPGVTSSPLNSIHEYGLSNYTIWNNSTDYAVGDYVEDNGLYYQCTVANGPSTTVYEPGVTNNWGNYWTQVTWNDKGSSGTFTQSGTSATFEIDISETAANDTGTVIYTEAALYAGTDIFAMKTYPAKIKDNSVLLKVIWTITF